jgi:hypothetical protein
MALAITDEASPFALLSTRNRLRRAVRRGAAWTAECHRGAAWLWPWPESRWQCLPPSSPGCRSPQAAPAAPILGRRSEIGQRRRAGRECQDACHAVPRPPVSTVWRPLSGPAFPGPAVPGSSRRVSSRRVSSRRVSSRPVSKPWGCPAVGVSAASALSGSRSAAGSVRPGGGDGGGGLVGLRASIGRDLARCPWVGAAAALDRLID